MKTVIALLLLSQFTFAAGKLQNEDFKTRAQIEAAGGTQAQLLNDTKIYVTANGINSQLSSAITSGQLGGSGGGGVNFLANGDFEVGPTTSWTLGSGVTAAADTTNFIGGKQSAQLTLASTNGDVISQDVTKACSGINLEHTIWVKTSLTTLQACSKQGASEIQCQSISSNDSWAPISFNSVCPASGTIGIKIKSTSSTSGTVNVDLGYVGTARNIGNVSQATFYGGLDLVGATGCSFQENTSSGTGNFVDLGTGSGCNAWTSSGNVSSQATNDHRLVANNMPTGAYKFTLFGTFDASSTGQQCNFRLSDGTNTSPAQDYIFAAGNLPSQKILIFYMTVSESGNKTFKVQASDNGANACRWNPGDSSYTAAWKVERFPSSSERALSLNSQPNFYPTYSAYITNGGSCAIVRQTGDWLASVAFASTGKCTLTLKSGVFPTAPVCVVTSVNDKVAALAGTDPTTSTITTSTSDSVTGAFQNQPFNITCTSPSAVSVPMPLVTQSVSTNGNAFERIERANLSVGSSTINSQSGSWITHTSSVTGQSTYAILGFTATPSCACGTDTTAERPCYVSVVSATSIIVSRYNAGALNNGNVNVICMGPR